MKLKMKWYRRAVFLNRKKALIIALTFFFTLFLLILSFRNSFLEQAVKKAQFKFKSDYNSELTLQKAHFTSFTEVELLDLNLVPIKKDTLFSAESVRVKINFLPLLTGTIQINSLALKNSSIALIKNQNGINYEDFIKRKKEEDNEELEKTNYALLAERITNTLLNFLPEKMEVQNLNLKVQDFSNYVGVFVPKIDFSDHKFDFETQIKTETSIQTWKLKGTANPRKRNGTIELNAKNDSLVKIPFLAEKMGLKAQFKKATFEIYKMELEDDDFHIEGKTSTENLLVNHPKIAPKDVTIQNSSIEYHTIIQNRAIVLDSSSTVSIEKLKINPYLKLVKDKDTTVAAGLSIPKIKAQDFVNSLPKGLFSQLEGLEADGSFEYKLRFGYSTSTPDDVLLDSKLTNYKLKVTHFGNANLLKLNDEFTYQPIENGIPQTPFLIGTSNPNYIPLSEISPYLQKCVLTSEDPFFFYHKGFEPDAFKQSILKNIKTKKFTRGASTISMQLVKNIFLTKEKTIARKAEEIILVYILENNTFVSKERMLEIYFNIIEWGPKVYGIQQASQFYFNKSAKDLTLEECLYLTSIVPKPKKFIWQFDAYGNLREHVLKRNHFIESVMLKRNLISPEDTLVRMPFSIQGPAKNYIKITAIDSTMVDSINRNIPILED